jgi:hypothetical protein
LAKEVFSYAPKVERNIAAQDDYWNRIRDLRNRVFHHERILHWKDLEQQHSEIQQLISWMDPKLSGLVDPLDRFLALRRGVLGYWLHQSNLLLGNMPDNTPQQIDWSIVDEPIDYDGTETIFGPRWCSGCTKLSPFALSALAQGKWLACDVREEYIHYLKLETS